MDLILSDTHPARMAGGMSRADAIFLTAITSGFLTPSSYSARRSAGILTILASSAGCKCRDLRYFLSRAPKCRLSSVIDGSAGSGGVTGMISVGQAEKPEGGHPKDVGYLVYNRQPRGSGADQIRFYGADGYTCLLRDILNGETAGIHQVQQLPGKGR